MAGGEAARTPRHLSHHLPWGVSPLGAPSALSTRGQVRGRGPRPPTATCTDTRLPRTPKRPPDASPGRTPALHSNAIRTKAELSSTLPPPPAPSSLSPLFCLMLCLHALVLFSQPPPHDFVITGQFHSLPHQVSCPLPSALSTSPAFQPLRRGTVLQHRSCLSHSSGTGEWGPSRGFPCPTLWLASVCLPSE